jgi:hypothetical protein
MGKLTGILVGLLLFSAGVWLLTRCRKEEIVIVYSKINTVGASNTTSTTTNVEGNITELTTATHSEYGICWDSVSNPTVYKQKSLASGTAKTGSFTIHIDGLKPAKTYHIYMDQI